MHLTIADEFYVIEDYLSGGNQSDISNAARIMSEVISYYIIEDKVYDSDNDRVDLKSNNNITVIHVRKNRIETIKCNKDKFKENRRLELRLKKIRSCLIRLYSDTFNKI